MPNLEKFVLKPKHVVNYPMKDIDDYEKPLNLPLEHLKPSDEDVCFVASIRLNLASGNLDKFNEEGYFRPSSSIQFSFCCETSLFPPCHRRHQERPDKGNTEDFWDVGDRV